MGDFRFIFKEFETKCYCSECCLTLTINVEKFVQVYYYDIKNSTILNEETFQWLLQASKKIKLQLEPFPNHLVVNFNKIFSSQTTTSIMQ